MKVVIDGIEYQPVKMQDVIKKPREFKLEVDRFHTNAVGWGDVINPLTTGEVIHAIEKLPGHVMLSRCQLELAWKKHFTDYAGPIYKAFCKELGLGDE